MFFTVSFAQPFPLQVGRAAGAPVLAGPLALVWSWASSAGFTLPHARGRWWESHRHGKAPPALAAPHPWEPPAAPCDGATPGDMAGGWG